MSKLSLFILQISSWLAIINISLPTAAASTGNCSITNNLTETIISHKGKRKI
jgi:hypothetical protein